jgi:hypothetical protein
MAEAHPVGFQWVIEAKARGARVIHVDPRFSRTSAMADLHVPIRAGADTAFLGGIVNYILQRELDFREYVVNYTNAATIVTEDFATPRIWTGCSPASTQRAASTTSRAGCTRVTSRTAPATTPRCSVRRPAVCSTSRMAPGWPPPPSGTRRCSTRTVSTRSSSGTSPATPRRWSRRSAGCRGRNSRRSAGRGQTTPAGSAPPRWSTRSAGPSTPSASSTSAPARSSSFCSERRVERLHEAGTPEARLFGHDPNDGVGGDGAFFLLLDEPEVYGLPPDPVVTTRDLPAMWRRVGAAAATLAAGAAAAFATAALGGRR